MSFHQMANVSNEGVVVSVVVAVVAVVDVVVVLGLGMVVFVDVVTGWVCGADVGGGCSGGGGDGWWCLSRRC